MTQRTGPRFTQVSAGDHAEDEHNPLERKATLVIGLGIILVLLAVFLDVPAILMTIGVILIAVGAVLAILGSVGRAIGPRAHYW